VKDRIPGMMRPLWGPAAAGGKGAELKRERHCGQTKEGAGVGRPPQWCDVSRLLGLPADRHGAVAGVIGGYGKYLSQARRERRAATAAGTGLGATRRITAAASAPAADVASAATTTATLGKMAATAGAACAADTDL
jgi:hypothetical protein